MVFLRDKLSWFMIEPVGHWKVFCFLPLPKGEGGLGAFGVRGFVRPVIEGALTLGDLGIFTRLP